MYELAFTESAIRSPDIRWAYFPNRPPINAQIDQRVCNSINVNSETGSFDKIDGHF